MIQMRLTLKLLMITLAFRSLASQTQEKPLPDREKFLIEFQVKRNGLYRMFGNMNNVPLESQYTYTETVSEMSLDGKGNVKNKKKQVFEVMPTRIAYMTYRKQTVKDDVAVGPKELEKQDLENEKTLAKVEADRREAATRAAKKIEEARRKSGQTSKTDAGNPALTTPRAAVKASAPPVLKVQDSPILRAADFQLIRREYIDGHPVILMTFKPNPKFKGSGDLEKVLQHTSGRVWVSETDYELVKIEADVGSTVNFGLGLLAKVQPGSRGVFEWRKINNEVWLPYRQDFTAKLRILLIKGQNIRELHEFSGHRKYAVSTQINFEGATPPAKP